jgi:3-oxoacyl-[acyl-carrier-protein] synthase III
MRYSRVFIDAIGYELAPVVVTSDELEERLAPLYQALRIPAGQLEAMTGIVERRWWEEGDRLSRGAESAARRALDESNVLAKEVDILIYAGVCREQLEPATACHVAAGLGISPGAAVYDLSNACLGMLNGMVEIANRIELGQIRAGIVATCETSREIVETMIERMLASKDIALFKTAVATLTGGSGAAAILLTDGSFGMKRRRLMGGVTQTAPEFFDLCWWGFEPRLPASLREFTESMRTDPVSVMKQGVALGLRTWNSFLTRLGWAKEQVDKIVCHQVGSGHRSALLKTLGLSEDKDFSTYPFLGNMGTASVPMTAALAEEREFLKPGDRVGLLGIGSGLNCLMLGVEW